MTLLHEQPSERYASLVRGTAFGTWLVKLAFEPVQRLAVLPDELFAPPGPLAWLPAATQHALIGETSLCALRILGALACLACLFERGARTLGLPAFLLIYMHESVVRGYGHTNHAEIPALLAVLICAAGATFRVPGKYPEPLAVALVLLLTYTLTAAHRIAYGGLQLFLSDSIVYWSVHRAHFVDSWQLGLGEHALSWPWFARLLQVSFPVVTLCELVAPLALISRRLRLVIVPGILGFHVGVLVIMNILFWQNAILLVVLFLVPDPVALRKGNV
jgi:hypothetical protein